MSNWVSEVAFNWLGQNWCGEDRQMRHQEFPFFFSFIFISWRLLTLQHRSGFCHTLKWISHGFTRSFILSMLSLRAEKHPSESIRQVAGYINTELSLSCIHSASFIYWLHLEQEFLWAHGDFVTRWPLPFLETSLSVRPGGGERLPASFGQTRGMLLSTLQSTGRPHNRGSSHPKWQSCQGWETLA